MGEVSASIDVGVVLLTAPAKVRQWFCNHDEWAQLQPQLLEGA